MLPGRVRAAWLALLVWGAGFLTGSDLRAAEAGNEAGVLAGRPATNRTAQVYVAEDPGAVVSFFARPERVQLMVTACLTHLTGKPNLTEAWRSLLSTQDTVGLKVYSAPGPVSGTRPAVVEAVAQSLLRAGWPGQRIIIWDKSLTDLRLAGFGDLAERLGVRLAGSANAGYDEAAFYDSFLVGKPIWGDFEFGQRGDQIGRRSYVSKLVTREMTRIINLVPLLNHNQAGVSGVIYGLAMGSVDNAGRFESQPERLAMALPEIYALPSVGDKVVLNLVDALLCQYQGEERSLLHYSTVLGQVWLSTDPVALDVLAIQELDRQRAGARNDPAKNNLDIYKNASLLELGVSEPKAIKVVTVPVS